MQSVQHFFGVTMLAVAIYLISPVIPDIIHLLLWAALLIISAMYLKAIDPLPVHATGYARFAKGIGIIALTVGLALLAGALAGGRDVLQPLAIFQETSSSNLAGEQTADLTFKPVKSLAELESQLNATDGRYVMLDFSGRNGVFRVRKWNASRCLTRLLKTACKTLFS